MRRLLDPRLIRPLFWLIATLSVALALLPGAGGPAPFPHADKVQHFVAFALLAGLAWFGFPATSGRVIFERLALLGAGIEVFQSLPFIARSVDVLDWAADVCGAGLAILIFARVAPRRAEASERAPG